MAGDSERRDSPSVTKFGMLSGYLPGTDGFAGTSPAFLSRPLPLLFRRGIDGRRQSSASQRGPHGLHSIVGLRVFGHQQQTSLLRASDLGLGVSTVDSRGCLVKGELREREDEAVLHACKPHFRQPRNLMEADGDVSHNDEGKEEGKEQKPSFNKVPRRKTRRPS
ncbi:hypothetical protein LZ31DRAFT_28212 [Colletotrichum somersetense]|nr:hypothetical protein LZ31DRAFT_28212 [Colletotrichum somersetense]